MENIYSLNIDRIPKELKLILKILEVENERDTLEIIKDFNDVDWNLFLELTIHHRIYPLIHGKLKKINSYLIPTFVLKTLGEAFKINTLKMLQLSGEMERVSKIFEEQQIRMLVLKGPVLAENLYGDLSLRTCSDLDILVSIHDLDKIDALLHKYGYVKEKDICKVLNDWKWRHHHIGYLHPDKKVIIEIHWKLNPFPGTGPKFEDLWLRKRKTLLTNYPIYYLGREDLFLFLVSHGARHGWFRIRWLVDIKQMVKQSIDWKYLINLLKKYQYLHVGGQALILVSQLLNVSLEVEMRKLLKGNHSRKIAQGATFYLEKMVNIDQQTPIEVTEYHKNYLVSLLTKRRKFVYFLSFLYPYPIDVETLYLSKHFRFLYFPLRPFLWAWRKTKRHSLQRL